MYQNKSGTHSVTIELKNGMKLHMDDYTKKCKQEFVDTKRKVSILAFYSTVQPVDKTNFEVGVIKPYKGPPYYFIGKIEKLGLEKIGPDKIGQEEREYGLLDIGVGTIKFDLDRLSIEEKQQLKKGQFVKVVSGTIMLQDVR